MAALPRRRTLVDYARRQRRYNEGAALPYNLDESIVSLDERAENLVTLDEALTGSGSSTRA